ncbi:MAG: UDP-N-acetylmuramate dehydrogenase [Myxococcota bacterium]
MIERDVPLAPMTTLELGGAARYFCRADDVETLRAAIRWARGRALPVAFLGGGSNLIVPDEGYEGLVVRLDFRGVDDRDGVRAVMAGENWSEFVDRCVDDGLAGVECLAGIPGSVGATPIQNVGAYGQEVCETIVKVHALRLSDLDAVELSPKVCEFAYRDSAFKRRPNEYVVTRVDFALAEGGAPARRYAELQRATTPDATLQEVRDTIVALRRRKSMVLDDADPNRRSAGSFFTNPLVTESHAREVAERAVADGLIADAGAMPSWPAGDGQRKLAAAWLIEGAGYRRGSREGAVGQSSAHALALVHHGGGTAAELLAYADAIAAAVETRFRVHLEREPRILR